MTWSISTKVWYRAGIELATPGSAVRHASVARHVTDCATRPGINQQLLSCWDGHFSFHLTTFLRWASLTKWLTSTSRTYFRLQLTTTLLESAEGRRMALEIILWSIRMNVWDQAGIKLMRPWTGFCGFTSRSTKVSTGNGSGLKTSQKTKPTNYWSLIRQTGSNQLSTLIS